MGNEDCHFFVRRCHPAGSNGVDKSAYHLTTAQAAVGHDVSLSPRAADPDSGCRDANMSPR